MISEHLNEADGRVVRLRPRTAASQRSHLGKAAIAHSEPDYSPVPDLLKYERPESIDDYRHRMVVNAIALASTDGAGDHARRNDVPVAAGNNRSGGIRLN